MISLSKYIPKDLGKSFKQTTSLSEIKIVPNTKSFHLEDGTICLFNDVLVPEGPGNIHITGKYIVKEKFFDELAGANFYYFESIPIKSGIKRNKYQGSFQLKEKWVIEDLKSKKIKIIK